MAPDNTMGAAVQLGTSIDALAAMAAHARVHGEGLEVPDEVRDLLDAVMVELVGDPSAVAGVPMVGLARTLFRLGSDLIENPQRSGDWNHIDPMLLQSIGRMSGAIAGAFAVVAPQLAGLGALAEQGATFLDVGTGTGWLAIAMAQTFPSLHVTGIDLFETPLALARDNVAEVGLVDRVELRLVDVTELDQADAYDAVWLPLPFLPRAIVPAALAAAFRAVKPGGWVVPGTFAGPPDRLSELLVDLRTVRSGGAPWKADDLLPLVAEAGLTDGCHLERSWTAPVHLFAGRKP